MNHITEKLRQGIAPIEHKIARIGYTPTHEREKDSSKATLKE